MSKFNTCICNGSISFGDDFDTVAEVTALFGHSIKKIPFHNWFDIPGKPNTIGCLLSEDGGKGWHNVRKFGLTTDSKGWNEVLTVSEYNDDPAETLKRINEELEDPKTHYVFYRESRQGALWYKFYGEFKIDVDSTRATLSSERPSVIYRRAADMIECKKVDVIPQTFTDAEFRDLATRPVIVKLLDVIEFTADCGEVITGKVTVMPDMKLFVASIDHDAGTVICKTEDQDLLAAVMMHIPVEIQEKDVNTVNFAIPLADFRLGYVNVLEKSSVA